MTEMARPGVKRSRGEYKKAIDVHKEDIEDLVEQGKTTTEIAHIYGYDPSTIRKALKRWGVTPNGRYGNTQEKHALILNLYLEGKSVKEIEDLVGVKHSTIYRALNANGVDTRSELLEEARARRHKHYAEILRLLTEGYSLVAIRRITGYEDAPRFVHRVPGLEDLWKANKAEVEAKDFRDREQTMKEDLARKTFYRIEYIGGFSNAHKPVRLKCVECSGEFQYSVGYIQRSDTFIECPYCRQKAKDRSDRLKRRVEARRREADRLSREFKKAYELERKRVCSGCGCRVDRAGSLCDACRLEKKRAQWKANEIRRKRMIDSQACIDKSITLRRLSKRDNGICYLCGKPVDWSDYRLDGEQKQCGNKYPSIDHVIPLAHGGSHTWDNVKLAHRFCNSLKSDSTEVEQMFPLGA